MKDIYLLVAIAIISYDAHAMFTSERQTLSRCQTEECGSHSICELRQTLTSRLPARVIVRRTSYTSQPHAEPSRLNTVYGEYFLQVYKSENSESADLMFEGQTTIWPDSDYSATSHDAWNGSVRTSVRPDAPFAQIQEFESSNIDFAESGRAWMNLTPLIDLTRGEAFSNVTSNQHGDDTTITAEVEDQNGAIWNAEIKIDAESGLPKTWTESRAADESRWGADAKHVRVWEFVHFSPTMSERNRESFRIR